MFRPTGYGKIEVGFDSGAGILEALLYNFDFDDFDGRKFRPLKAKHTEFLENKVLPALENDRGAIWLQGSASRIGTNAWNMETSMVRAGQVRAYLLDHGVSPDQIQADAVGEELAATHAEDEERDRSVRLWVFPKFKYDPPPPRRVPPRPKISRHFKLAMLTGLSVSQGAKLANFLKSVSHGAKLANLLKGGISVGGTIDMIYFIVWDTTNKLSCIYIYIGLGPAVGLSFTPKVSGTTHGPWNSFTTEKPIGVWQFGRWSNFATGGAFNRSVTRISIETPEGVDDVHEWIDTGTTLGAGLSISLGDFIRASDPLPFNGP